ncbi:MAG: hypothetical protein ACXVGC_00175 [Mycobacteriaceae bacterium]
MLSQPDQATLTAAATAVEANAAGRGALVDNLVEQVRALLASFTQWYSDPAVLKMSRDIGLGMVLPTQKVMASQEDAYLANVSTLLAGKTVRPVGAAPMTDLRVGVDPADVYERLARQYRYERSTGMGEADALTHVLTRADVMNQADVALAARRQDAEFFAQHKVTGYRRVIHPELAKTGTCGLCIAASDQIYHRDRLLPLHDRCNCGVMPIIGGFDAGSALNNLDLSTLYTDAAGGSNKSGTNAADLKRTRYQVDHHGELGPTLVPKDSGRKRKAVTTRGAIAARANSAEPGTPYRDFTHA